MIYIVDYICENNADNNNVTVDNCADNYVNDIDVIIMISGR